MGRRLVGVVGSRELAMGVAGDVGDVVEDLLERGYHIGSGGAIGADQFVIERLLRIGRSDECTVYAAWKYFKGFPLKVRAMMRQFSDYGGHIVWGQSSGNESASLVKMSLLLRNQILVDACYGLVAFVDASSRGTIFTIQKAAKKRMPLVVFCYGRDLPKISHVKWVRLRCGGCWEGGFKAVYLR